MQTLSALIIIGESLVHTPPLLLRKILPKVTPGPRELDGEALLTRISLTHTRYQTRISRIYTNVRTVDSGLMNVRDNLCNWCLSLCIRVYKMTLLPFQSIATKIDQQADAKFRGGQIVQHLFGVRVGQFFDGLGLKEN